MKILYFIIFIFLSILFLTKCIRETFNDPNYKVKQLKNFLDKKEICAILNNCNNFYDSRTVATYGNKVNDYRTSTTCSIDRRSIAHKIIADKINSLGFNPLNLETLQLTKYTEGQYFKEHFDYFNEHNIAEKGHISSNGQRLYTLFVYLKSPEEGGETYFSNLKQTFKPNEGDALLWENCKKTSTGYKYNKESKHSGLPVTKGYKIGMNIWITDKEKE